MKDLNELRDQYRNKKFLQQMENPAVFSVSKKIDKFNYKELSSKYFVDFDRKKISVYLEEIAPQSEFYQVDLNMSAGYPDLLIKLKVLNNGEFNSYYFNKL